MKPIKSISKEDGCFIAGLLERSYLLEYHPKKFQLRVRFNYESSAIKLQRILAEGKIYPTKKQWDFVVIGNLNVFRLLKNFEPSSGCFSGWMEKVLAAGLEEKKL
jgi:hypothetical protein